MRENFFAAATAAIFFTSSIGAQRPVYVFDGQAPNDRSGRAVDSAGDVNADGFEDIIVGAPRGGGDRGSATVFSGKDGSVLYAWQGDDPGDRFGFAVAGIGDLDGDGHDDLAVGAPLDDNRGTNSGSVRWFSGRDGSVIVTRSGAQAGDRFGHSVAAAGDINANGIPDTLIGAPALSTGRNGRVYGMGRLGALVVFGGGNGDNRLGIDCDGIGDIDGDGHDDVALGMPGANGDQGRALIMSGRTYLSIYTIDGDAAGDLMGRFVAAAGDVNNDTVPDFMVTSLGDDDGGVNSGRVRVYSGRDGTLLQTFDGDGPNDQFGGAIDGAGDVDGDGHDDVIIGSEQPSLVGGYVRVHSGRNGAELLRLDAEGRERFGAAVAAVDIDCNGTSELVVGAHRANALAGVTTTYLYSPVDSYRLGDSVRSTGNTEFGGAVAVIGDVNGDGHEDYVVGASADDNGGNNAGAVRLYSGQDNSLLYEAFGSNAGDRLGASVAATGDVSGDGIPDFAAGAPQTGTGNGYAVLYSGLGGAIVTHGGRANGDRFGACVAGVGDYNADGFPDFAVGGTQEDNGGAGYVFVYSEHPRGAFVIHGGANPSDAFGAAITGADVTGDGRSDVIISATQAANGAGYVRIFDSANNSLLREHVGGGVGHQFGKSLAVGDVNGDGSVDLAVGAPFDSGGASRGGAVSVFSGSTGAQLIGLFWTQANTFWGWSLSMADIDQDGSMEFLTGTPFWSGNQGFVNAYSVQRGAQLNFWPGQRTGGRWGAAVSVGDMNRDGINDVLIGEPAGRNAATRMDSEVKPIGWAKFYGGACVGSTNARPRIDIIGKPRVASSFIVDLDGALPGSPTFLAWGMLPGAKTVWAGLPLPFDLGVIGAPDCFALTALDATTVHRADGSGRSGATIATPLQSVIVGQPILFQWINFDPAANRLGVTTSNALEVELGG